MTGLLVASIIFGDLVLTVSLIVLFLDFRGRR
jgi:hypothetical protein